MKNVITKTTVYKDYGLFQHVYFVDVNYNFNEKSVKDIIKYVKSDPFSPVMIHTNDISIEIIRLIKKISELYDYSKEIWLKTDNFLFEDFMTFDEENFSILGLDKIDILIDKLGDEIDLKFSWHYDTYIPYEHVKCPF